LSTAVVVVVVEVVMADATPDDGVRRRGMLSNEPKLEIPVETNAIRDEQ